VALHVAEYIAAALGAICGLISGWNNWKRDHPPLDAPEYVEGEVIHEEDLEDLDKWFSSSARRRQRQLPPP
jgi:hypothetical protein